VTAKVCLATAVFRRQFLAIRFANSKERPMWFGQQTASWQDFAALSRRLAADEAELRQRLWRKIKHEAASLPYVEDALTAHYCAFDRGTPFYVKAVLIGAVVYFFVPDDLIPDSIPVIGYADDAAVLAAAMKLLSSHIKPEHREAARRTLARMRGEAAA
jgi:uncharacterized membrane protein YkvA (DUF1232 family)